MAGSSRSGIAGREVGGRPSGFGPGWDRLDPWTLRFVDVALERSYLAAMAEPGRQRLRIACLTGFLLWAQAAVLGPPLLNIPAVPVYIAALIAGGGNVAGTLLTRRSLA